MPLEVAWLSVSARPSPSHQLMPVSPQDYWLENKMFHLKWFPLPMYHKMSAPAKTPSPKMLKFQKGKDAYRWKQRKKRKEIVGITGEDVCRVSTGQTETSRQYGNRIQAVKCLLSIENLGENDVDNPRCWVLTVIKSGHTWEIVEVAVKCFDLKHLLAILEKEETKKFKQFCQVGSQYFLTPPYRRNLN